MNMRLLQSAILLVVLSISARAADARLADSAQRGDAAAFRTLLVEKADVNASQPDGATALHWIVRADDLEAADQLIRAGANVTAANRKGITPLDLACINGSAAMIRKLLD